MLRRVLMLALLSLSWEAAALDEIVGTWEKSDSTLLEFKADGSIFQHNALIGRWMRDKTPVMKLIGAKNSSTIQLQNHQRTMTVWQTSSGVGATLKRRDDGPTFNPDVPDQRAAQKLERVDLQAEIEGMILRLERVKKEAADLWREYHEARDQGRSTSRQVKARQKDSEASGLERSLVEKRKRIELLALPVADSSGKANPPRTASPAGSGSQTALKQQCIEVQAEIEKISLSLEHARKESVELWKEYHLSREESRATNQQVKARGKDSEVLGLERKLVEKRKELALLNLKLKEL